MDTKRLAEEIGQKFLLSFAGYQPPEGLLEALRSRQAAGVTLYRALNVKDPEQVRALAAALQGAARDTGQPPLLIAADQEGGQLLAIGAGATPFPGNMALGATGSEELARRAGRATGLELAAMGVNVNYAPVCDLLTRPGNATLGTRTFSDEPGLAARLAAAFVQGLQSAGVAATAKHFPGYGEADLDAHHAAPSAAIDEARLRQVELPPFAAAIRAGAKVVMAAHLVLPALNEGLDLPATLSAPILKGLLRRDLGFEGVIASDALDMAALQQGPGLLVEALAAAAAGVDLLLFGPKTAERELLYDILFQAARRGLLDPGEIARSAGRVLALRGWLGGHPQPPLEVVGCAEHRQLAVEIARRSVTRVRDSAGLLPLRLPAGARLLVLLAKPADLTPAETSSLLEPSLAQEMRRFHPDTEEIVFPTDPTPAEVAALRERARQYEAVIAGTFDAAANGGQAALVHALLEDGLPLLVAALRTPFDLSSFPGAPAYVCTYGLQPPSMQALAEALWGQIPFLGLAPVAIPV